MAVFWLAAVRVGWSAGWFLGSTQARNRSLSGAFWEHREVVDLQPPKSLRGEHVGEVDSNEGVRT